MTWLVCSWSQRPSHRAMQADRELRRRSVPQLQPLIEFREDAVAVRLAVAVQKALPKTWVDASPVLPVASEKGGVAS